MGKLDGKVAVITGGASGMGRASAILFAREGASVVVTDLNSQGGEMVVSEIAAAGGRAVFQRTDFNNAGVAGAVGPLENIEAEDWDRTFAVLTRAPFFGIKHSIAPMRKSGGGSIISTASAAAIRGVAGLHAYSAAKAAVVNLTQSAAIALGRDRIRVNCICPGVVLTPLIYRGVPGGEKAAEQSLARMQPIARVGRPEDIAAMALFLASDDAQWITGTAMIVDGGVTTGNQRLRMDQLGTGGFSGPSFER
jgi:NAD(P)-dependent dehydrogenase (short-subunit alcohol dehydrogenase family)